MFPTDLSMSHKVSVYFATPLRLFVLLWVHLWPAASMADEFQDLIDEQGLARDLIARDVCVGYYSGERPHYADEACAQMLASDPGLSPSRAIVFPEWLGFRPGHTQAVGRQAQFSFLETPENFDLPEGINVKGVSWLDYIVIRDDVDGPRLYSLSPSLSAKDRVTVLLLPDCSKKPLDQVTACTKKSVDKAKTLYQEFAQRQKFCQESIQMPGQTSDELCQEFLRTLKTVTSSDDEYLLGLNQADCPEFILEREYKGLISVPNAPRAGVRLRTQARPSDTLLSIEDLFEQAIKRECDPDLFKPDAVSEMGFAWTRELCLNMYESMKEDYDAAIEILNENGLSYDSKSCTAQSIHGETLTDESTDGIGWAPGSLSIDNEELVRSIAPSIFVSTCGLLRVMDYRSTHPGEDFFTLGKITVWDSDAYKPKEIDMVDF